VRALFGATAVLCLVACAGGPVRAVRSVSAPFVKQGLLESTGAADIGSPRHGGGELIRFIPRAEFGIGIVLENGSDRGVIEPTGTPVHQIGTILRPWQPFTCPPGAMCPFHAFGLRPFDATPRRLEVGAGKEVAVALGFRLSACTAVPLAVPPAPSDVLVTFRVPGAPTQRQQLSLGSARLLVRGGACRLRG
jgi:hypothetical protein